MESEGIFGLVGVVDVTELEPAVVYPPLLVHHLLEARLVALVVPVAMMKYYVNYIKFKSMSVAFRQKLFLFLQKEIFQFYPYLQKERLLAGMASFGRNISFLKSLCFKNTCYALLWEGHSLP